MPHSDGGQRAVLEVTNLTPTAGKRGAEHERLYCATYSDAARTLRAIEYNGSFRRQNYNVEYTAFTTSESSCAGGSQAQAAARLLTLPQLQRRRNAENLRPITR